ncbi:cell division protein FtsW (lipid II flippase) [Paenibacillus amylolyticus]|uniref:Cell division protein FtsW (Lipid II flippase) n=1 Tax=Paenibacillus amylolyticus TaxID=1451 RepID=A0AAP5H0Z1_PAEAM|nr:FtsW/RodA/SpoVE family cell cycle protein [Paenibacillus amylolyticus]MDR6723797.1 cell division protein FtsW (lipid II flippase) [Paenibacillus amylolyticus]
MKEPNRDVEHYLDEICSQVKAREVHKDLRDELGNHMEEMMLDREQEGFSGNEAAAYAIEQMGNPEVIGKRLHRLHRQRIHWGLLTGLLTMALISLLTMWIYTTNVLQETYQFLYVSHIVRTVICLLVLGFFIWFDYRKWRKLAWPIYILLNLMMFISAIYPLMEGQNRYFNVLGFAFDLSSAALWILPLAIGAIMLDKLRSEITIRSLLTYIGLVLLPAVLFFQLVDWVRLVLFVVVMVILFAWFTKKWLYTTVTVIFIAIPTSILMFANDNFHRLEKIWIVFDLQNDPYGMGYYNRSIIDIVQSAGWWGNGLESTFTTFGIRYLDYPLVMLIDVFGWSAGVVFVLGIVWFIAHMIKMIPSIRDEFGRMMIVVITMIFGIQMFYSVVMTTGYVPIISVIFPFLSHGSHLTFEYAVLGLVLGIYRRKDTLSIRNEKIAGSQG